MALLLGASADARGFGAGRDVARIGDVDLTVYTYRPHGCATPALLFVFHGNGRHADRIRDNAIPLADRACLLVFAPLFDRDRFANWRYHAAGVTRDGRPQPREAWTGALLRGLIAWARWREARPQARVFLFGHSAGGQFLSRIAAFDPPEGVARFVVANPSAHVSPATDIPAPYGFGGVFADAVAAEASQRRYLELPLTIYLGERDRGRKNLVQSAPAMRQGTNRLERGRRIFAMARDVALRRGWRFGWRLVEAPDVGHSSAGMLTSKAALEALGFRAPALAD